MNLIGKSTNALARWTENPKLSHLAFAKIISVAGTPAYLICSELFALIVLTAVYLCITVRGVPVQSAYAFAGYGAILCSVLGDYKSGYKFAKLALEMLQRPGTEKIKARITVLTNYLIIHWKEHLKNTLRPLQEGCQIGLETGDLEYATLAADTYIFYKFTLT